MEESTNTNPAPPPNGQAPAVDSEESFQKTYFPQAFARNERERDSAEAIGCELGRESAVLIRSAFSGN